MQNIVFLREKNIKLIDADNFYLALCWCKFAENWLLFGGTFDFRLFLQTQSVSSATQSCQIIDVVTFSCYPHPQHPHYHQLASS